MSKLKFIEDDFKDFNCSGRHDCPNPWYSFSEEIAGKAQKIYDEWLEDQPVLYGYKEHNLGWRMFENTGRLDTHACRAVDIKEIEE